MENKDKMYELIVKDLTSDISENEKEALREELSLHSLGERTFPILKQFWSNFFPKKQNHNIIEKTKKKLDFTYGSSPKSQFKEILKVAAIILFVLSFSFSSYQLFKPKQKLVLNEYCCAAGEIKEITLSDGTKVWLNSKSFLIASEPFIGKEREVKLYGEAYFEVAHNDEQPFIVKTPQLKTRVLGTHFNVVAYPTDEVHEISLHEGKIKLAAENRNNPGITLNPGDRAYFTTATGTIKVIKTDLGEAAKWRDGILRFYDEDLLSISKKLERQFHKKILITDNEVGQLKFSAEFDVEQLGTILTLLSNAHEFSFEETELGIIIKK